MPVRRQRSEYTRRAKVATYSIAFRVIGVPFDNKARLIVKMLEKNGERTESSICYAIFREQEFLREHRGQEDFWKVFGEVIKKWSWAKDDPRWEEWKKKKEAREKAKLAQQEMLQNQTYTKAAYPLFSGFIYFIQGESGGPIKIGYTTDLEQRLKTLQTGYPDRLDLLLAFPGKPKHEKAIHKQFEPYRLNGEWFRPTPEVMAKIKEFAILNAYVSAPNKDLMQLSNLY